MTDWKNRVTGGRFSLYVGTDYVRNCDSISLLYGELTDYVLSIYPLTFDNIKGAGTVFTDAKYANSAKLGIAVKSGSVFQDKHIDLLLGEVRHVEKYWEVYPSHSISQLKLKADRLISDKIDSVGRVSISSVIDLFMEQGFTPCSLYAYLIGFMLKEYSVKPYRFSEGVNGDHGGEISPEKLGDMIGEYFKHLVKNGRYVEQYIEIMSPDQAAFVSFVSQTFGLHDLSIVESAANKLRTQYKNKIRYPLWCFKCIDTIGLDKYISKLAEIMYSGSATNVPTLAGELGKMLLQDEQNAKEFSALITPENAANAMKKFLDEFEGRAIPNYAEKIGVFNMLNDVANQIAMEAKSYLWDQQEGEEQLRKLLLEYRIIDQTNTLLSVNSNTIAGCFRDWKRFSETLKLPYAIIKKHYSELSNFVVCLLEIIKNDIIPDDKRKQFLDDIINYSGLICKLRERIANIYVSDYSISISGLSNEEITAIMSEMPNSSFMDDNSDFELNLQKQSDKKRKEQKKYQLKKLWKDKTGYASPDEWSKAHLTPIRAMVDGAD